MKAIISTTYDDKYLYFLPIVTWLWNRLGVDIVCFMPPVREGYNDKHNLIREIFKQNGATIRMEVFTSSEHKEATYAQCSRLYAGALSLPDDEVLILSDIDMAVFQVPPYEDNMTVFGADLVPEGQYPMCYVSAKSVAWWKVMDCGGKTYQQCLDDLLGDIECSNMRGNYWAKDQETLKKMMDDYASPTLVNRSNGQNQFATKRYDRDDSFILDRLNPDTIDYHMNRPGYEPQNFDIILTILKYHYPNENFQWLCDYNEQYKKLL